MDEKDQNALNKKGSSCLPQPARSADTPDAASAAADAKTTPPQVQANTADSTRPESSAGESTQYHFVTFDPTHKHLVRVVEVKGKRLSVLRFDKKSGKWLTKTESRERNSGISLSPEEAEKSFPGCVAAWTELSGEQAQPAQQSIAVAKKMSPEEEQYLKAIAMSSADLGAIIKKPTERIAKKLGQAIVHSEKVKKLRREAQSEFDRNIAYYYEAKERLLNPGYRADVDGGKDRTPDENQKNFGAPDWATFNKNCAAYSLQHADRKLKAFAQAQGLLTEDGGNIDDPEPTEEEPKKPEPRRSPDLTAQRRYEHIATAAMAIANANPEDGVSKQILAAAEYVPAPQMPLPPDVFTEVLLFITKISSSVGDGDVRAEAKRLLGKMLLHRPMPDPVKVLAEATEEEKRKRAKRLAQKNGEPLGSASYNPPTNGTSELIQKSHPISGDEGETGEPQL